MSGVAALAVASATKLWVVLGSLAGAALFSFALGKLVDKHFERRLRALARQHPEHAADVERVLGELRAPRSWRERYRDGVGGRRLTPPARVSTDRKALPILLGLLAAVVAALLVQAASGSALAGWIAFAGLPVVLLYGLSTLLPARRRP